MTIGEKIKIRRESLGLSVTQLAERIGKDRTTIYRYESSYIESMPISTLEPLAKALQTTPAFLMGWEDDVNQQLLKDNQVITISGTGEKRKFQLTAQEMTAILTLLESMKKDNL